MCVHPVRSSPGTAMASSPTRWRHQCRRWCHAQALAPWATRPHRKRPARGRQGGVFRGQDTGLCVGGSRRPRREPESRAQGGSRGSRRGFLAHSTPQSTSPLGSVAGDCGPAIRRPPPGQGGDDAGFLCIHRGMGRCRGRRGVAPWTVTRPRPVQGHEAPASSGHTALGSVCKGQGSAHVGLTTR